MHVMDHHVVVEIGITVTHTHTHTPIKRRFSPVIAIPIRLTNEDLSRGLEFETQ